MNEPFEGLGMRVTRFPTEELQQIAEMADGRYVAVDSFCGPGGMSLGLKWSGFDVRLAFDYDAAAVETHRLNLPGECLQLDAREASAPALLAHLAMSKGELALLAGGPPCQGFSKQKRGAHLGDERNDLVLEFTRLVEELSPRYMLFENVAIFGQARGKRYIAEMRQRLVDYELTSHFCNAADFGVPQTRQRFIMVGRRKDQAGRFIPPSPTVSKWRTVGDVLHGLPSPPLDKSVHPAFPNHATNFVTKLNVERFKHVPQGGGWMDIPYELRLQCHKNADTRSGGWPDVYGRLEWNGQCPTITGGFDSFTRGRYGHPIEHRPITPREAARIQGFPDDYVFVGNRSDVRSQIGNVVPPPLAEAVGLSIARALLVSDGLIQQKAQAGQTELFEAA